MYTDGEALAGPRSGPDPSDQKGTDPVSERGPLTATTALRKRLAPCEPDDLAAAARETRRQLWRASGPSGFDDLLPWPTLTPLVTADALCGGTVRAMRRDRDLPLEMLTRAAGRNGERILVPEALQQACRQGLSLVVNAIDADVPAIAAMNAMLERHLRCDVLTNAYASYEQEGAFSAHYDSHDVLILQIHGRKRWWCHGQVDPFPVRTRVFSSPASLPASEWEGVLEPGDVLFVPRGDVHHAAAFEGEASVHLTVTLLPPQGIDLLRWIGRRAQRGELARRSIPAGADAAELAEWTSAYRQMLHQTADELDLSEFLADADRARAPVRPLNPGFAQAPKPTTVVQPSLRRRIPIPTGTGDIPLQIGPTTVKLGEPERAVLATLVERDSLSVSGLSEALAGIDVAEAVAALARKSLVFLFDAPSSR